MTTTIVSWNVNSARLRVPHLAALIEAAAPDVIALQETKIADADFPLEPFAKLGFGHAALNGAKGQAGVALLSRRPLAHVERPEWCGRADGRHVYARLPGGIEVHSVYVPAGGDVPDPAANPKFAHKLRFLAELANWFAARKRPRDRFVLAGDLNVAPLAADVWSHRELVKVVSHTPVEVAALDRLARSHDWIDAVRTFVPDEERLYSWWSYRAADWRASDRGRRLDHVWVTRPLRRRLARAAILKDARDWDPPSDHVPVVVTLAA
ncbi:MAG: exodeoxyribonuclease III [Alphaproteobacteria bacterium]